MIGQVIARYRILEPLGAGGMGVVYRAEDLTLRRHVGLKVLPPTASPQATERFLREARAAAALNHPNICTIHDAGDFHGQPYIAMELLQGQTLRNRLAAGALPPLDVLDIAVQIADGLAAAHAKGIIHRDIKPANIWVTDHRHVKILDFGLAKLVPGLDVGDPAAETVWHEDVAHLTAHANVVGTVGYMSPEQARGEALDTRTDLFSFGVVLYEMFTGRQPFRGATSAVVFNAILSHDPAPLEGPAGALSDALIAILDKALEKDRGRRFQHAADIAAELRELKRQLGTQLDTVQLARPVEDGRHDTSRLERIVGPAGVPEALRSYLRRFPDADVQQRRVRHYIWPTVGIEDPITGQELMVTDARSFIRATLMADPEAFILLLGDYGAGKTSFLQLLGRELATDVLTSSPDAPFPIYLNLRFARRIPDLLGAMSAYLARHGVSLSPAELGSFIARHRNVVLLLDGFDEMAGWVDYGAVPDILDKIRRLQSVSGVRLVLSGRSSFFRSDVEVGIVGASHVARLRPLDDRNMIDYVNLRDPGLAARAARLFHRHPGLRELCRNPIHLMLFTSWLASDPSAGHSPQTATPEAPSQPAAEPEEFSVADLYQRFFSKTLQDNFGTLTRWRLDQRWAFVRGVAWRWFSDDVFEWPFGEFSKRIKDEFPDLSADEVDRYTLQLLNCTFFTRVGDRYRFVHRSYLEYLVSQQLADALIAGDLTIWEDQTPIYTDIFEMTYQLLKARGLDRINMDWVMGTGGFIAQAKVLTMAWRHHPPEIERHVRTQMRHNPHDLVRLMSSMGIALYGPSPDNVTALADAFRVEPNSVVRALLQRVASAWLSGGVPPPLQSDLQSIADSDVELRTAHAERALLQRSEYRQGERVLLAFRRAMVQGDQMWPAAVGGVLSLGVVGHEPSFSYIHKVAAAAQHPEIRAAYAMVQPFTKLPDLPPT